MPSIQHVSGDGYVTKDFWKAKEAIILAGLEAADRTLVTDNSEGTGTFPVRLRLHGCSTGVHLPTDAGATRWAPQPAHEASLAVSTDADPAFSTRTFWLQHHNLFLTTTRTRCAPRPSHPRRQQQRPVTRGAIQSNSRSHL